MISWPQFRAMVIDPNLLDRHIDQDQAQENSISAGLGESLFIVAGPGSGKTTVLTLRVLKLIYVDDVDPQTILATTFTRRAAAELRSRILGWGDQLRQAILAGAEANSPLAAQIERLDLNRIITGTLDSIAEQVLGDFREPGTQPPILLEEFVADAMMQRAGLWSPPGQPRSRDTDFLTYIQLLRADTNQPNLKEMLEVCREVRDRFLHEQIDTAAFEANVSPTYPGAATLCRAIDDYAARLNNDLVMDFAVLEAEFLARLNAGLLDRFTQRLQVILVDEYQDTNFLQEQIYFALARRVNAQGGSVTVVGDDDQSLYRFRGATVEIFRDFQQRLQNQCSIQANPIYLSNNYRSTQSIVHFYADFIGLDPAYTPARVVGKPRLSPARSGTFLEYPILGMFRPTVDRLADDLAQFLGAVFNDNGVNIQHSGQSLRVVRNPNGGSIGDCALLCSSPREYSSGGNSRLPLLIRRELANLRPIIQVFNPRGEEFSEIHEVALLCGLMLECIDPGSTIQNGITNFPPAVPRVFNRWRSTATQYIATNPQAPNSRRGRTLENFVRAWQNRNPQNGGNWPQETPLMSLLYNLITWIPILQDDPEGLVCLEVITRTITQSARFVAYGATVQGQPPHADRSVRAILWGIFEPLASGAIDIDEDLIETLPRNRLNILSIHQAKGLEFPMTIVDIGSDFQRNHWKQAFKRFPRGGSHSHILEDALRPFSPLGLPARSGIDRAFDDLVRQYFVSFSRPQDVLLLVGLGDSNSGPNPNVPNIATGWIRNQQWPWRGLPGVVYL